MARILIKNVRKDFGNFTAVRESSFTIEDGELLPIEPVETSEDVLAGGDIA